MNGRDLERRLHFFTNLNLSDLDQRSRRLRSKKYLPSGARGLNAPALDAGHVRNVLLSLAAERAVDVCEAVLEYAWLTPVDGDRDFLGNSSFGETLKILLEDVEWDLGVREVTLCRSWPEAVIITESDGIFDRHVYRGADAPNDARYENKARVDITFSAGLIHQLAGDIAGITNPRGGWGEVPQE